VRGGADRLPGEAGPAASGRSICPDSDPTWVRTGDIPYPRRSTEVDPVQGYWPEGNIQSHIKAPEGGVVNLGSTGK